MEIKTPRNHGHVSLWRPLLSLLLLAGLCQAAYAGNLTINVVGPNGAPIAGGFRWLVEEDATKDVDFTPAQPGRDLSLSFHTSYMPVAGKGDSATGNSITLDGSKRYYVSVLPKAGYQMGGAAVAAGASSVTVTVNPTPIPTAQISVFAFRDEQPINGVPDLPEELGLGGFSVLLSEPGGTYGMSGGQVTQDAFGNPLGTTYNASGTPITMGNGTLKTGADGTLLIKNLAPGKYGVQIVPPAGANWHQTSTIEGSKTQDAWVKANEPSFFQEFGPPGHHVFIGFVHYFKDTTVLNGNGTITGTVVNLHTSRPPSYTFYNGNPIPNCRVGLNETTGRALYADVCNADSSFAIDNVPPGSYELVVWDEYLDMIFATYNVTVPPGGGTVALQEIPIFNWNSRMESVVFYDGNQNGIRDEGEAGIPEQAVNLRFRDGSIYQSFPTDTVGYVPFDEVFPFFNWLIAEVDFTRFKATGATIVVDAGGAIDESEYWSYGGKLNPQLQVCTQADVTAAVLGCIAVGDTRLTRTETGPVLLEAFQGFLGQTNVIEWGKVNYAPGENGGITGVIQYATTRAENDPRYAAAETWEPGIPRVRVNLYKDANGDKKIDDVDGDGVVELADVDNYPFDDFPGPGDVDRATGTIGTFDLGDAIQVVKTDSWDDSLPSGCQGEVYLANGLPTDCYDGLRNFNQVRPGVFDGGFAFVTIPNANGEQVPIPAGTYIVEAVTPPGYELVKEEDKNVDFGDEYKPSPLLLAAECVGDLHLVPDVLSLFPDQAVDAAYARQNRPLCDRKQVVLQDRQNAAANFFLFTDVPVAGHIVGMILNDLANEFDPNAPTFGEKQAPSFIPVSIRDWTGREISRVYSDQYGNFNALVPSTYSVNIPMPSGVSPNMLTACMNSPFLPDGSADPHFDRQYSQFCYTLQYMPGKTTYLDTPVVPVAAFAGPGQFPVDCEFPNGTPAISWASGVNGPWLPAANVARGITIGAVGSVAVPNPDYDGTAATPRTITRDFGFGGTPGSVTINGTAIPVTSWTAQNISATIPAGTANGSYQLMVTRGDGATTKTGLTFTVGGAVTRVAPGGSIQAAIDAAPNSGSPLILVPTGSYDELVIMHKPVRLQGWGLGTRINAVKAPSEKLANWRSKLASLLAGNQFSLLPGQTVDFNAADNEPALFGAEEGPGILVLGNASNNGTASEFGPNRVARIDGFSITGADYGGGIFASGYARNLQVSNNRIYSNQGTYGGGVRIGHVTLLDGAVPTNSHNENVRIQFNQISQNGAGEGGAGGGISLYTGANNYQVQRNNVCGNFSMSDGGGIGHLGLSPGGTIESNAIVFNQNFNQGLDVHGGGLFIGGAAPIAPAVLSAGSGNVDVLANLIQGNQAGAGDGGGISTEFVNGTDVQNSPGNRGQWHRIRLYNNIIVDNMAGTAGGGISLQDSARVEIIHNTVANNDSTATTGITFAANSPNQSTAQPAGIVSHAHSAALAGVFATGNATLLYRVFSNPTLTNNIVWHNRSFYWKIDAACDPVTSATPCFGLFPRVGTPFNEAAVYADLAVLGTATASYLTPRNSILTTLSEPGGPNYLSSNRNFDPLFVAAYVNRAPGQTVLMPEATTSLTTAPAFDEGGNYIDVRFGPLSLIGDYHLLDGSPAEALGATSTGVTTDVDGQARPQGGTTPDAGADERL